MSTGEFIKLKLIASDPVGINLDFSATSTKLLLSDTAVEYDGNLMVSASISVSLGLASIVDMIE